jgi:hypothetical protein
VLATIHLRRAVIWGGIVLLSIALACDGGSLSPFASPPRSSVATPTQISIAVQPGNALSGDVLSAQPVILFRDANNAPTESNASVTAALSSSGGTLGGTLSVQAVNGRAAFTDLFVTGSGTQTLQFTANGLPAVTSASFDITTPAAQTPSAVAVQTQPGAAVNREPFGVQPVARILDNLGLVISSGPNAILPVTASLAAGTGTLTGTTTVNAAAGVARFTDLQIVGFGPHRLKFAVATPSMEVTSASFAVAAGAPASLSITAQPSSAVSGQVVSPIRVEVRDADGNPTSSADSITASLASGSGTLTGLTKVAAVSGVATFSFLTLAGSGPHTLTFTGPAVPSSASAVIVPLESAPITVAQTAAALSVETQPNGAITGLVFTTAPVVRVVDNAGLLMPSATNLVTATLVSGTGTLLGTFTATTVNGRATFPDLRVVGTGTHKLQFSATGLTPTSSADFSVSATGSPATKLVMVTEPSPVSPSGVALAVQPAVQLQDANSSPVAQAGVVVRATMGGGGQLGGALTATTNVDGVATFTSLLIAGTIGPRTLTFTGTDVAATTSSEISLVAGAPAKLGIATQPSASAPNTIPLAQQPAIQIRDASDNDVSQAGVVVTAALASGGGTIGGTLTATTNASGTATFGNLSITGTIGGRTLSFSAAGLLSTTSGSVTLTVGPATKVSVTTQPSATAQSGAAFATPPVAQLRDVSNQNVSQSGILVSVGIGSGTGTLGGTTGVLTSASGVATFVDAGLNITGGCGPYTLQFTSAGLTSATSTTITVTGVASKLSVATQPSATAQTAVPFAAQPVIQVRDACNNAVAQSGITVTAAIASGTGTIGGSVTAVTNTSGVAPFTSLSISGTGAHTISFTDLGSGLTSTTSTTVNVSAATLPNYTLNFSQFATTAALLGHTHWLTATSSNTGDISLSDVGYGGSPHSMQYNFPDRTALTSTRCHDYPIGPGDLDVRKILGTQVGVQEMWAEVYVMFSSNFKTLAPAPWSCSTGSAYKFIFMNIFGGPGRFDITAGVYGNSWWYEGPGSPQVVPLAQFADHVANPETNFFDGTWHRARMYVKLGAQGHMKVWLDNTLWVDYGPFNATALSEIWSFRLGANMNQGPGETQFVRWGLVRLWWEGNNPGW